MEELVDNFERLDGPQKRKKLEELLRIDRRLGEIDDLPFGVPPNRLEACYYDVLRWLRSGEDVRAPEVGDLVDVLAGTYHTGFGRMRDTPAYHGAIVLKLDSHGRIVARLPDSAGPFAAEDRAMHLGWNVKPTRKLYLSFDEYKLKRKE